MKLQQYHKATTNATAYPQHFREWIAEKYEGYKQLYTDGSKDSNWGGAAAIAEKVEKRAAMPREAYIFSAELHAIQIAVDTLRNMRHDKFLIISDSMSVLKELGSRVPELQVARRVQRDLVKIKARGKQVKLWLVPGHSGLNGNEMADKAAKVATKQQEEFILIAWTDWTSIINDAIYGKWNSRWQQRRDKLREIKL